MSLAYAVMRGVADPVLQRTLFDTITDHRYRLFAAAAGGLVAIMVTTRYVAYRSALMTQQITNATVERLVLRLVDHFYGIDYKSVVSRDYGYYMSRVYDEPVILVQQSLLALTSLMTAVATAVGALAVCFWLSWKLAVVLLCILPITLYLSRRSRQRISQSIQTTSEQSATLRDGLGRVLRAYVTVNMYDLGVAVRGFVQTRLQAWETSLGRRSQCVALFQGATAGLFSSVELIVLLGGVLAVMSGQLTVGGLMAFLVACTRVMRSFEQIGAELPVLASVHAALTRMEEFLALREERRGADGPQRMMLRNASFGYATTSILRDLSLSVEPGQRVLVSGPNGCGKSTLAYILSGFLRADSAAPADTQSVPTRQRISALLLPFAFIPGTVKDNVAFDSLVEPKLRRFLDWARSLGLLDKLDRDPSTLSQGEQRKVQVMMTLLKDATYYIFDEPLSHLDKASEPVIMDLIFRETRDAGLLVIMHGGDTYHGAFDTHLDLEPQAAPLEAA